MRIILMAGWQARFCENNRDPHLAGPCLPHLHCASLRAPYLARSSEQAVERVLGQDMGSEERKMILVTVPTNFTELLLNARRCS